MILCLQAHGITSVIVSEPSPARAAQAKDAGASHVFDPMKDDVVAKCRGLGDGRGAHCVFECAGVQASMDAAVMAARGKGTIVNIALFETSVTVMANIVNRKQLSYVGSNIYTRGEFQEVIDAIAEGE